MSRELESLRICLSRFCTAGRAVNEQSIGECKLSVDAPCECGMLVDLVNSFKLHNPDLVKILSPQLLSLSLIVGLLTFYLKILKVFYEP